MPSIGFSELRSQIQDLMPAILALFQENYTKGEVLVVSYESFQQVAERFPSMCSLSNIWHTEKFNSDLGRLLYDYSNLSGHVPVNSEFCRESYRSSYGDLIYPTLRDFAVLYLQTTLLFPGQEIWIAKSDVHRAYHRFRWTPEGSLLLSLRINENLVAIPITGGFGSNGLPFIYDPIRRFLSWLHSQRMSQLSLPPISATFVDDMAAFGPLDIIQSEFDSHEQCVNSLLGPNAAHRRELGKQLDIIGARFDTVTETIGISFKGYLKLLYLFFKCLPVELSRSTRIQLKTIQSLAGVTTRYGDLIPLLRPTSYVFYALMRNSKHLINLNRNSINAIQLWRSYLQYAFTSPHVLSSPIQEYFLHTSDLANNPYILSSFYSIYSDATLHSIGLYNEFGWCHISVNSFCDTELPIAIVEFFAAIAAFLFALSLKPSASHVHLFIDNQNAISWSSGNFKTQSNIVVSLVYINCLLQSSLGVIQTRTYIRSSDNVHADQISRTSFLGLNHRLRFSATPQLLEFFRSLAGEQELRPFEIPQLTLTTLASEGFNPF